MYIRIKKLWKERFVEKSVRLSQTIHRTNLKTFLTIHKTSKTQKSIRISSQKQNKHQMRVIETARSRGRTMEELLGYD